MNHGHRNALLLFLFGSSLLFIYSSVHAPRPVDVRELTEDDIGDTVTVSGTIDELSVKDEISFLRLRSRPSLEIVVFEPVSPTGANRTVRITGTVSSYHGQLELVVDQIHR